MRRQVVRAQLLRVDHSLALAHPLKASEKMPHQVSDSTPALLVIPRGGNPREPHLVTQESLHRCWEEVAPVQVMTDPHTVMCAEDIGDGHAGGHIADVVVHRERIPGPDLDCDIAVSNQATWSMLRIRGNKIVGIAGPAALLARTTPSWLAVYGSAVHCWLAAGLPVGVLGDAVVAVGHYYVGISASDSRFSVAARAHVFITQKGASRAQISIE